MTKYDKHGMVKSRVSVTKIKRENKEEDKRGRTEDEKKKKKKRKKTRNDRNKVNDGDDLKNKAGYTATSCGRVGRSGNARFPTFGLDGYGPTDRRTDGRTDGQSLL